jgi:AraC family transcriptional regulator
VKSIEPRYEDGAPMLFAGIRRQHTFEDRVERILDQWAEFRQLGELPGQTSPVAYGAMCQTYEGGFEYMCAVEVDSFEPIPEGLGRMRVPAQGYAVFTHRGNVADLGTTWGAIWNEWLPSSGRTPANTPDFEKYGDEFDPATGDGLVEIWFPVEPE